MACVMLITERAAFSASLAFLPLARFLRREFQYAADADRSLARALPRTTAAAGGQTPTLTRRVRVITAR